MPLVAAFLHGALSLHNVGVGMSDAWSWRRVGSGKTHESEGGGQKCVGGGLKIETRLMEWVREYTFSACLLAHSPLYPIRLSIPAIRPA
ncbi:uncharacterized protein BDZ99DRAFT_249756 [Mytilinidion resinicola]|uniref:Uncharacterized protein n=1 Tax=Mytilinidion resinicola TaxID=574789 RepID=A0A6A6YYW0_9PEZI|nr:uncharacterized protein BDZ99DRAFT_249756 [Mytilinidion resinicola]KAF2813115.1 hypothetical protein BDZ99DRAFT_249756 [Mytilinidion resinicola]